MKIKEKNIKLTCLTYLKKTLETKQDVVCELELAADQRAQAGENNDFKTAHLSLDNQRYITGLYMEAVRQTLAFYFENHGQEAGQKITLFLNRKTQLTLFSPLSQGTTDNNLKDQLLDNIKQRIKQLNTNPADTNASFFTRNTIVTVAAAAVLLAVCLR